MLLCLFLATISTDGLHTNASLPRARRKERSVSRLADGSLCMFCSEIQMFFLLLFSRPQVINIINAAQESSPVPVAEALDRVLEILRTAELYSPQLASKDDDPHANDLVGGLMNVRGRASAFEFIHKYKTPKVFIRRRSESFYSDLMRLKLNILVEPRIFLASEIKCVFSECQRSLCLYIFLL